ncbi:MAG: HlyD family efflux transporter periplasmic adaptor subunit [Candidatus Dadabacteria bacterium]|nr:MAG: HlyD family efflux transporter periplasmic adaptor subunit [Candidatus Dadabacteria bacterium]
MVEAVFGIGTVRSDHEFTLRSGIQTRVQTLHVRAGEAVAANAPLVTLDTGAVLRTPIRGTVTQRWVEPGEMVMPGQTMLQVRDLQARYIELLLDQDSALRIRKGMPARATFESLRGEVSTGTVTAIYPSAGQFVVRLDFATLPEGILPDMSADIAIEVGRRTNVLQVPVRALHDGHVRVLRDGRWRKVPLKIGVIDGQWAEVVSGDLNEGDQLRLD